MAWTWDFLERISATQITPIYVLESVTLNAGSRALGGGMRLSSALLDGYTAILTPAGSSVSYGSLRTGDWSYTQSEWSVGLQSQDLPGVDIRHATARGQIVALRIGFPGWSPSQYQTVAIGVVQDIGRSGGQWSIRCRSILAALTARSDKTSVQQPLFRAITTTTTLASSYVAGAATVEIAGGFAALERETGGVYAIRITDDNDQTFVVTASAKAVGPPITLTTAGVILGADANAASGNRVEVLAYVQDHPLEVIRKVLTSTGAGTNGSYDTLPASWGLALDDALIDDADCRTAVTKRSPNGVATPVWDVIATESVDDPLGWIASVLSPMGAFLCERQGLLTIRGATTHWQQPLPIHTWEVGDDEIVSLESYSAYDPSQPVEYSRVRYSDVYGSTDLDEAVSSMPAIATKTVELPYLESDRVAWREHIRDATGPYYTRIGEPVSVVLCGWRLAQAAVGDHLRISTHPEYLSGRRRGPGSDLSTGAPILITSVEPDWFGATVRITGVHIPDVADE